MAAKLGLIERADDDTSSPLPSITPSVDRSRGGDPLSLDALYRAVQILQTAASQLSVDVWRGTQPIVAPAWIGAPDPWSHGPAFLDETIASLALRGNCYWRVNRGPEGQVVALECLDPNDVTITVPDTGPLVFHWSGSRWSPRDIVHLALMRRPGRRNPYGLGPIQACRESVDGAIKLRRWADAWTEDGTVPNGVLTSDQTLTQTDADTIKSRFLKAVKATEPVVLGQGTSYKPLLLTPQEMQWLDSQDFNVVAMARLMGIPPRLMLAVLDGTSQTYANQAQEDLSFVRWTLMAYLREIEAAFTWLLPRGQTARFNLDAILRADTKTRYEAYDLGIKAGFLTLDEVRQTEGLTPLTSTTTTETTNA